MGFKRMFSKPNRLPHDAFNRVFRTGKRIHCEDFFIVVVSNAQTVCRFAVQVGIKVDKRATQRNRMKRLLREAIRNLPQGIKPGFDCILIAKKNFAEKEEREIEQLLRELLARFNFLNNATIEQ